MFVLNGALVTDILINGLCLCVCFVLEGAVVTDILISILFMCLFCVRYVVRGVMTYEVIDLG